MTENTNVDVIVEEDTAINVNTALKPQLTNEDQARNASVDHALKSFLIFGSTGVLICLIITLIFSIVQVIIGRVYEDDCPINPKIPHYLVVAGSVALTDIILGISIGILMVAIVKPAMKVAEDDPKAKSAAMSILCIIYCIFVVLCCLGVFIMGWTIVGLIWVFGAWNKVQYDEPNLSGYCHRTLYRFTYWLFFLPFILAFILCCRPCCIICCGLCAAKNTRALRVPTSEP